MNGWPLTLTLFAMLALVFRCVWLTIRHDRWDRRRLWIVEERERRAKEDRLWDAWRAREATTAARMGYDPLTVVADAVGVLEGS